VEDLDGQVLAGLAEKFGALLLEHDTGAVMRVDDLFAFFEIAICCGDDDVFVEILGYYV
jgi:hypothetical protein